MLLSGGGGMYGCVDEWGVRESVGGWVVAMGQLGVCWCGEMCLFVSQSV